jgi:antitoxin component of RelBE/YafQ-DinJ toxin-antitoxin module
MAKISVRIDDTLLDQLRAIAAKRNLDLSDIFRDAIRAYLLPARPETTPPADPVLQSMSDGIRREAASRGLSPEKVVQLWFQMMRPVLPPKSVSDSLRLNKDAAPGPTEPGEPK